MDSRLDGYYLGKWALVQLGDKLAFESVDRSRRESRYEIVAEKHTHHVVTQLFRQTRATEKTSSHNVQYFTIQKCREWMIHQVDRTQPVLNLYGYIARSAFPEFGLEKLQLSIHRRNVWLESFNYLAYRGISLLLIFNTYIIEYSFINFWIF